ncbi:MAG: helix-turn-helix transcriptional regulator [Paracoccaceae bacterium]
MAETGLIGNDAMDFSEEVATFGDRLTHARETAGLTPEELAARAGVRGGVIRAWEEDRREPRGNQLQMLSGMLNVSIRWLLTGTGQGDEAPLSDPLPDNLRAALEDLAALRAEALALAGRMGHLEQRLRTVLREDA